jgi:hypothetical protein
MRSIWDNHAPTSLQHNPNSFSQRLRRSLFSIPISNFQSETPLHDFIDRRHLFSTAAGLQISWSCRSIAVFHLQIPKRQPPCSSSSLEVDASSALSPETTPEPLTVTVHRGIATDGRTQRMSTTPQSRVPSDLLLSYLWLVTCQSGTNQLTPILIEFWPGAKP